MREHGCYGRNSRRHAAERGEWREAFKLLRGAATEERAEEYGRRNAVPPEMLVRVTPTKVVAKMNLAD